MKRIVLFPMLSKEDSISTTIMANSKDISCSKSTVYRHFKKGYYSTSIIDLPRAVKFKPRRQKKHDFIPKVVKVGRSYDDFLFYLVQEHIEHHTEPDTVIGRIGGKVILTIHFTACNFMTGLLLYDKSSLQAASKFLELKSRLKDRDFQIRPTFDILLADNGVEFADVFSFEEDDTLNGELKNVLLRSHDSISEAQNREEPYAPA